MEKSSRFLVPFVLICNIISAQCPTLSGPTAVNLTCCTTISSSLITVTSNYSANITSRWLGPNSEPIASVGTATSIANIGSAGTYTVEFTDISSSCVVNHTIQVGGIGVPEFKLTATPSFTQLCTNSPLSVYCSSIITSPAPNAPVNFTYMPGSITNTPTTWTINPNISPTISCGVWQYFIKDLTNNCISGMTINITCGSFTPAPISIAGSAATLCMGSSVTYTASGVNTYTWNNGPTTPTINVIPTTNTTYVVNGTDPNGCISSNTIGINPNPGCAIVWPGDANSDGVVDNLDPFEIGLAMNLTGAARSTTSNAFNAFYCTAWSGTVSTGKNLCHADCNGDGTINTSDNAAITSNFSLTHAFKPLGNQTTSGDITIVPQQSVGYINEWNTADIFLGSATSSLTQLYGIAYELSFDSNFVENSSNIVFNQSFLNSSNQNITFNKLKFNNQKHYITNVRIDGTNVSGYGKIGEITYKIKAATPENSVLSLAALNVIMIDNTGTRTALTGGTSTLNLITNPIGVNEIAGLEKAISVFPNPAKDVFVISAQLNRSVTYTISDIFGKEIMSGSFAQSTSVNATSIANGTYLVKLATGDNTIYKRLIISK